MVGAFIARFEKGEGAWGPGSVDSWRNARERVGKFETVGRELLDRVDEDCWRRIIGMEARKF